MFERVAKDSLITISASVTEEARAKTLQSLCCVSKHFNDTINSTRALFDQKSLKSRLLNMLYGRQKMLKEPLKDSLSELIKYILKINFQSGNLPANSVLAINTGIQKQLMSLPPKARLLCLMQELSKQSSNDMRMVIDQIVQFIMESVNTKELAQLIKSLTKIRDNWSPPGDSEDKSYEIVKDTVLFLIYYKHKDKDSNPTHYAIKQHDSNVNCCPLV